MPNTTNAADLLQEVLEGKATQEQVIELSADPGFREAIAQIPRSSLLPHFFKINGKDFSLTDFPQFKVLYDAPYVPQLMYMCGRQVAKSTNLSRYEVLNCLQIPHFQVLYVAPLQAQTMHYSSMYLREAIKTCALARHMQNIEAADEEIGPVIKQMGHQSFANGAGIKLTYAKTSADRARGIFCDELDCDEIQDHLVDNLNVILHSLTQSEYGLRRYTGTAKTLDNTIEFFWQQSSQAEWVVQCSHCNHWNIPNKDGDVLSMIQIHGPSCIRCGQVLDVRKGEWVHAFPEREFTFSGYHIPQIVVPSIVYNQRRWNELLGKMRLPIATVYQEVLGISSSVGARLITQEDIDKYCTLPSVQEMAKPEWRRRYPVIVAGIDWGVAEQTSFTVLTILGIRQDGKMHVLWAKRYAGFDTDTLLRDIAQTCRYYKVCLVAADFGMGFAQNTMLTHRFNLPVIQVGYTRQQQLMSYRPILGYPRWTVDKVTALELMFWGIRYGHFAFPPKAESDVYTSDLLSPYEEIREERGLESKAFVRNPNVPDDFANALCFAMLGGLRLTGSDLLRVVPMGAMGADIPAAEAPEPDFINPKEVMRAYQVGG